jgi:hypothetical protein
MTLQVPTIAGDAGDGALGWTGIGGDPGLTSNHFVLVQAGIYVKVVSNVRGVSQKANES